jgi:hypothetical protein
VVFTAPFSPINANFSSGCRVKLMFRITMRSLPVQAKPTWRNSNPWRIGRGAGIPCGAAPSGRPAGCHTRCWRVPEHRWRQFQRHQLPDARQNAAAARNPGHHAVDDEFGDPEHGLAAAVPGGGGKPCWPSPRADWSPSIRNRDRIFRNDAKRARQDISCEGRDGLGSCMSEF